MARQHATAFVVLVFALLAVPAVFAATSSLGTLIQPFEDLLGRDGLGALYTHAPLLFDSIFALMIFVGLSMKTVGERLGKPAAIGLGLMLAIAYVLGAAKYNFHVGDLAPLAMVLVFGILAYLSYSLLQPLIENRVLAFAFSFMVIGGLLYTLMPQLPQDYPSVFQWVGLLLGISTIISVFAIIRMVGRAAGSGGGGGGGWGFGGLGWGGSRANTVDHGLDKAATTIGDLWNERKEKARNLAATVRTQFLGNLRGDIEKLNEAKTVSTGLRENIDRLIQYVTSVENTVKTTRVLGVQNGEIALRTYRQEISTQQGALDQYFQQQDASMQKLGPDLVKNFTKQQLDAIQESHDQLAKARTGSLQTIINELDALKAAQRAATKLRNDTETKLKLVNTQILALRKTATDFQLEIGEGKTAQLLARHEQDFAPLTAEAIRVLEGQVTTFTTTITQQNANIDAIKKEMTAMRTALNQKEFKTISGALPSELAEMQQKIKTYLTSLSEKDYTAAISSANIIVGNLMEFEQFEPKFIENLGKLATILAEAQKLDETMTGLIAPDAKDTSAIAKAYYSGAGAVHESLFALTAAQKCVDVTVNCAKALEDMDPAKITAAGTTFSVVQKKSMGELTAAEIALRDLVAIVQKEAAKAMAKVAKNASLPGGVVDTIVNDTIQQLQANISKLKTAIGSITKLDELKV